MPVPRKKIPKSVEHVVREECGQACANPKCRVWSTATHELHHIDGDRSRSVKENLILLCGSCHNAADSIHSEADILFWKRMAESGFLQPPNGPNPNEKPQGGSATMRDNYGVAGGTVHVGTLNLKRESKGKSAPIPGTIGANDDMRTHATYLVKRYIEWRKKAIEHGSDKRKFNPASAHSILAEGFGSPNSVNLIREDRFFLWVAQAEAKIDGTIWGRNNKHRNYHSWEDHLLERRGKKGKI